MEVELGNNSFKDYMKEEHNIKEIWNIFKKDFISTVKNGVEVGNDFIESAEKIRTAQEKLDAFGEALKKSNNKNVDKNTEKAWKDFKSAYDVMGGSGIFGHWDLFNGHVNDRISIPLLDDY